MIIKLCKIEGFLIGNEEVMGSNPVDSTIAKIHLFSHIFVFYPCKIGIPNIDHGVFRDAQIQYIQSFSASR